MGTDWADSGAQPHAKGMVQSGGVCCDMNHDLLSTPRDFIPLSDDPQLQFPEGCEAVMAGVCHSFSKNLYAMHKSLKAAGEQEKIHHGLFVHLEHAVVFCLL